MKRLSIVMGFVLLISLALMAFQVQASAGPSGFAKPHPTKEPGAVATQKADERAQQGTGTTEEEKEKDKEKDNNQEQDKQPAKQQEKEPAAGEDNAEVKEPKNLHFRGLVNVATDTSLTIALKDSGEMVTFAVTADTQVKIPTLWQCSTCSDLVPGTQVIVKAVQNEAGQLVALTVHVVPGKPTRQHRAGEVVAYQAGTSITILVSDGQTVTFLLDDETKILPPESAASLAAGAQVTIVCPRDLTGQTPVAKGIVIHAPGEEPPAGEPTP